MFQEWFGFNSDSLRSIKNMVLKFETIIVQNLLIDDERLSCIDILAQCCRIVRPGKCFRYRMIHAFFMDQGTIDFNNEATWPA